MEKERAVPSYAYTLRITEGQPLFAAIIRHAVLACFKTGNVGSSSQRYMDYMFI